MTTLPRYRKPPVIEVAMSVQFEELAAFQPVHFGLLWERWRERYPVAEHKEPLGSVVELFGVRGTQSAFISSDFPIGRYWYLSADAHQLIQVQRDKFVLNWRKLDEDTRYPSYDTLRERFEQELDLFLEFLETENIGRLEPTQAELTYVNHIPAEKGLDSDLERVLAPWSGSVSEPFLPSIEDAQLFWQYKFEENGKPIGRLHIQLQTALSSANRRLLTIAMTGRGAPIGTGSAGALRLTDKAHEWIVRGFTSLTTDQMHNLWERE